jgi:hypothetical protein
MSEAEITTVIAQLSTVFPDDTSEELRNRAIASISAVEKVFDGLVRTLVAGDNIVLTPDRETKTIEIESSGGGGGGHVIIDEAGNPMPQRENLQFTGAVEVTDDIVNDKTVVEVTGGSGGNKNLYSLYMLNNLGRTI